MSGVIGDSYSGLLRQILASKMTDTRRRVKLYELNAERQWDDKGTGHVSSTYVERLKGISLVVRSEQDGSLLLHAGGGDGPSKYSRLPSTADSPHR